MYSVEGGAGDPALDTYLSMKKARKVLSQSFVLSTIGAENDDMCFTTDLPPTGRGGARRAARRQLAKAPVVYYFETRLASRLQRFLDTAMIILRDSPLEFLETTAMTTVTNVSKASRRLTGETKTWMWENCTAD